MAKLTINYLRSLAWIVRRLGLNEPRITCKQREDTKFYAIIEVDLLNWVSMGYRGPREFTATSSISTRKAIRKSALDAVTMLEKCGLVKINDFSSRKLDVWKARVMGVAKICKEVAEERDDLEWTCSRLQSRQGKLLTENARLKAKITELEREMARYGEGK
jgi:hypothetical protein